jgi:hypothetical protein
MKFILPLFLFVACTSSNKPLSESKESELKNHFMEQYKMIDATSRVDSFFVLQLDTITEQKKYASLAFDFMDELEKQNQLMEIENSLLQKRISLMQLTIGQPGAEKSKEEAKQSLDSISAIETRVEAAQKKINYYDSLSKKADSVKPIGYEAICIYRVQKQDWTDKVDTAYILMDRNKDIVSRKEFYKE